VLYTFSRSGGTAEDTRISGDQEQQLDTQAVISSLSRDACRRKALRRVNIAVLVLTFGLLVQYGILRLRGGPSELPPIFLLIYVFNLAVWGANKYLVDRTSAATAANTADVRLVGALVDVIEVPPDQHYAYSGDTYLAAQDALIRLLPSMSVHNAVLISDRQRDILVRSLQVKTIKDELKVGILRALKEIDDGSSTPLVEKIAGMRGKKAKDSIRIAAEDALPVLRSKLAVQKDRQTLLRAAGPDSAEFPSTLVRPAAGFSESEAELLLRPADSG